MKLKTSSNTARRMPGPPATSSPHPVPDQEHHSVLPRKQDQKSESDKTHGAQVEPNMEQASVIGEAERPQPPSEKPEAS